MAAADFHFLQSKRQDRDDRDRDTDIHIYLQEYFNYKIAQQNTKISKWFNWLKWLESSALPKRSSCRIHKMWVPSERDSSLLYPDQTFLGVILTSGSQVVKKTKFGGQRTSPGIETVLKIILSEEMQMSWWLLTIRVDFSRMWFLLSNTFCHARKGLHLLWGIQRSRSQRDRYWLNTSKFSKEQVQAIASF